MNESSPSSATTARPRPRMSWRRRAGIFAGALVLWLIPVGWRHNNLRRNVDQLEQAVASETKRQAEFGSVKPRADLYRQLLSKLRRQIDTIQYLLGRRANPVYILKALGKIAGRTRNVRLMTVSGDRGRVALSGDSLSDDAAKEFVAALEQSGNFSHVELRPGSRDQSRDASAYAFTLDCTYSPPPPADTENQPEGPAGKPPASRPAHP